ncbi:MAG: sulfite exporter TauE/SafE family protein [Deltaproteobacteria bacterium]|nr:sulfite exporter TauE/SafE family protein [Deltaproteobacteria bacterium]MBI3063997.1 sulfite exporter TauE/SafE family protein [Deltaproteobacteria bacterium]
MSFLAAAGISLAALLVAAMVLMSGFGLGTLLTPLFVLFYDIKIAVLLVAVVHFSNNLFKLGLFFRHLDLAILKRFGALSIAGAFVGSLLQAELQSGTLKIGLGILLVILGTVEFLPPRFSWSLPKRFDPLGGFLSGLLGGVLGNQGAVRSAYLLNYSLSKEAFVATATIIACLIDATRIPIYLLSYSSEIAMAWPYLAATTLAAFLGTLIGKWLLDIVSLGAFRRVVAGSVVVVGVAMAVALI